MLDLNSLFYFAKVVELGGFSQAERTLGIPKSTLSRHVASLEEKLSIRLLQRSTRRISMTEAGQKFFQHCKGMLLEAQAAHDSIEMMRVDPCGTVRMSCPIALLHATVGDMIADFMLLYPKVTVHLEATNRVVDLISDGIDLAIRVRRPPLPHSDLLLRVLSERIQTLVVSPSLIKLHGWPDRPNDLVCFPSLGLGPYHDDFHWSLYGPNHEHIDIAHKPRLISGDMIALRDAAVRGVGVVQLPLMMVRDQINQGSLVRVLENWAPKREVIHIVYPSKRGMMPSVRALIDYLAQRFAELKED